MTPELLPMLKPFAQAVAAQRVRVPTTRAAADRLEGAAKQRAWWISGLTREALVKEAHTAATRAIEDGLTKDEFLEKLGGILDENGGTLLSPKRLELIAQNNVAVSYAAGRYAQMRDPAVTADRPYWQYPLGPNDARTSQICRKLEGFIARFDHPSWDHIYPPNHHGERHLQVLTLTEEQARELGIYEGPEYPKIDGQDQMPDAGWDFKPDLLGADDAAVSARADFFESIAVVPARVPADYGLGNLEDVDLETLAEMAAPIARLAGTGAAEIEEQWQRFRAAIGFDEGADMALLAGPGHQFARVTRASFEKLIAKDDRSWLAPLIRATVEDPFEIWEIERRQKDGSLILHHRFIGLYRTGDELEAMLVILDSTDDLTIWDLKNAFKNSNWVHLEKQRAGRLVMSKLLRRGR